MVTTGMKLIRGRRMPIATSRALDASKAILMVVARLETVKPGRVPGADGELQAPHVHVVIFARGLLRHLHTRVYFEGDPANNDDAILALVPAARRSTLLARSVNEKPGTWHIDIRLQGEHETVFFDV